MKRWLDYAYSHINRSLSESTEYFLPHSVYIGPIGAIGFPLYYWIWTYIFPQPYENLTLRLIGSFLFLGLAFIKYWPAWLRPYTNHYWMVTITYGVPFFFLYMLLMNNGNIVWGMSTMAGLTLLILVAYNWALFIIMFFVGSLLALLAYTLTTSETVFSPFIVQVPIYLFLIITTSGIFYYPYRLKQEKLQVLASVGAEISHELRTPLMTIQNHAYGLNKNLPALLHAYKLAQANNLSITPIRPDVLKTLERSIQQIENEVRHSNTVIDMLLMNVGKPKINTEEFSYFSMAEIIRQAIDRYPFDSSKERSIIQVNLNQDFQFLGSDILMMHVIFNLIKNALVFTNNTQEASIKVTLDTSANANRIYFRDNGRGIPLQDRAYIFENFYSSGNLDKGAGTGIGLAFCQKVLASFNASIKCDSEFGKYTEFVLSFPLSTKQ
ncbi:CAI-1 autoinducer sensor kinase/phosphatase CqsS [Marinomonas spartinae]|uniref:sensor histidine kinase n=1 Tax=Marinomonas spartinae TaxID=1792290 RepID=UPI000808D1F6|nr:HAMP domain-containing sensor histidine kinase [Marinomonas spartinae]SBS38705.1 CAI-1 autoinducer sensor kinase/phosphatase CqsS [Marinomonas spartinae]